MLDTSSEYRGGCTLLPHGVWHVVVTRFSYRNLANDPSDRKQASDTSAEDQDILLPQKIALRSLISEISCIPSLCAQTNQNFDWVVVISKHLPQKYREKIRELVGSRLRVHIHVFSQTDDIKKCAWLNQYAPRGTKHIVTTNLDDDDALPSSFIEVLQSKLTAYVNDLPPMMTFGSKSTLQWDLISTRRATLGYKSDWHRGNWVRSAGVSLFSRYSHASPTVYAIDHTLGDIWFEEEDGSELLLRLTRRLGPTVPTGTLRSMESSIYEFRREWSEVLHQALEWKRRHDGCLYVELGYEAGPTVMTNHLLNLTLRLLDEKVEKSAVLGAESFPGTALNFDVFKAHCMFFEKHWSAYTKLWRELRRASDHTSGTPSISRTYLALRHMWRLLRL